MNAHEMVAAGSAGAGAVPGHAVERQRFWQTLAWGIAGGILTAASPLLFWWLPPATVYALGLVLIAGVYIGFAVADGRRRVLIAEFSPTHGGGRRSASLRTGLRRPSSRSRSFRSGLGPLTALGSAITRTPLFHP